VKKEVVVQRHVLVVFIWGSLVFMASCGSVGHNGSGGSGGSGGNVQPITAGGGPAGIPNGLFTNVVVCVPGSSNCTTVGGILVDTGSTGLRILSSALPSGFSLPQQTSGNGVTAECFQFVDGFTWGPVHMADVQLANEKANSLAVQIIAEPSLSAIPPACAHTGRPQQTLQALGANGILGVGIFPQDCGPACAAAGSGNPGLYWACSGSNCRPTAQALAQQLQQPVSLFSGDNNGVAIQLPSIPATGASTVNGSLIFGIGTQSNNGLGSATVLTLNNSGDFTTIFKGQSIGSSFIDSGSNALFFLDPASTGLPACLQGHFYCPAGTQSFSATNMGTNGASTPVNFSVANAQTEFSTQNFLFDDIAGPNARNFDWGVPFFYGRTVFTAIAGSNTPAGAGPYVAY
jgi:Protein of unknown function (DUF3443)